ncbi:MAG: GNAT family protein [Legionella sp.]|nr:GNAT family protein [Legionella sp.]
MKIFISPILLKGNLCTLEPLSFDHHADLIQAVADKALSKLWYTFVPEPDKLKENISMRLNMQKEGSMIPFACIDNNLNKAVGMTTFLNIDKENRRVEIGGTWYCKSMQRTGFNTECKFLLLTHAFESMNCIAVEFRTHAFNHQSRRGIERLGAKLDGVLRNHMIMPNGTLRDTYVYSIISSEWPTVKAHLEFLKNKGYVN